MTCCPAPPPVSGAGGLGGCSEAGERRGQADKTDGPGRESKSEHSRQRHMIGGGGGGGGGGELNFHTC